ncbi:UvrD-helicase domain-containing protein [Changchengzhania lutea]|uniref:UvrD-helicase domain-containing protein n=1 Tax=Changchengzhania lutea TaxID=2049305 RepID=UPI00115CC8CD|nr:UvrD-helicase domain-containing protein [Changchengzhania lutea]
MTHPSSFTIYNASAGSGKTYTLVKAYLKILFQSPHRDQFKNILAITFTNKAVAEMKDRVIDMLQKFSDESILDHPMAMFSDICDELDVVPHKLHEKSIQILNTIIHNYAAFDISTIDGFTHRIIRTFAYDLKLPLNFEVELDQEALLNEAVDLLIAKAGSEKELTKILVDFAIEKADDDKSWDVSFDFNNIAKLLVNENDIPFIEKFKDKTLEDFKALKTQLRKEILDLETVIVEKAQSVITLIAEAGLEHTDFSRRTLPNHFVKASKLELHTLYDNRLEENISERKSIYTKTLNPDLANTIDSLLPEIEIFYKTIKSQVYHLKFLKAFYKNITPLSVLNAINNELTALKEEQNKMLISEFNTIIGNQIKDQPTPFIYERIGEKFRHYFIDEFQDTSEMQWHNLMPLLDNALATINGNVMLVGDAKQAIYRWRGGKAEQFIGLFNKASQPFQIEQDVKNLETNYRSLKEIVEFNNGFFKYLATQVFNAEDYETLYRNSGQHTSKSEEGSVELSFLDFENDDDRDEVFSEQVHNTILRTIKQGFELRDICVLVRKKKEGVAVANYLSQHHIPIISSETLLLQNAPEVRFINDLLALLIQPKNNDIKIRVLNFMAQHFDIEDKHAFFVNHINLTINDLFTSLEAFNVFILYANLLQLPLFDLAETLVRSFNLVKTSNAYLQFYLDAVLDFSQKKGSDISAFLGYFEKKKESLSVVSPIGQNAVQIMTIHKSKGLEFPVVIFPYADLDIYRERNPREWFPLDAEKYQGFSKTLLNFNKDFEYYGEAGQAIFNAHKAEQELDNINLLYVTLTRAVKHLYVISKNEVSPKGIVGNKKYSGLLIGYLQHLGIWNNSQLTYSFGNPTVIEDKKTSDCESISKNTIHQEAFISTAKEDHNINIVTNSGYLWDTDQEAAIEKGNLVHDVMSHINDVHDINPVINDYLDGAIINKEQSVILTGLITQIVNHPSLKTYFNSELTIYNERDIITKEGIILRPDRVVINAKDEAVIIDYKTGSADKSHLQQLQLYQDVLKAMQLKVVKKILVYINDDIQIKEI